MKEDKQNPQTNWRKTLISLCAVSGLLLSIVCCIALVHVELRIQEHHRLLSHPTTFCDKIEEEILRKVQKNFKQWAAETDEKSTGGHTSRPKRSVSSGTSPQLTTAEVKRLIGEELRLLQNQICAKGQVLCRAGPKGNRGHRGRPGRIGPEGPRGMYGPEGPEGPMGLRGDPDVPGFVGPPGPRGPQGVKGEKGECGYDSAPVLRKPPSGMSVNEGQTAVFTCSADGLPPPQITWSKVNSSLPVGRHVMDSSGTLIIKNVKPEDDGVYSCRAENLLGSVSASARLTVQFHPSCSVIRKAGGKSSGNYIIDPDGTGGMAPFTTYCDMSDKNGVGVTVVGHDSESRRFVDGKDNPGEYSRSINYSGASLSQLASLTDVSSHCEQFIKYECFGSSFHYQGTLFHWWVSRDSRQMKYWGGASPGSGKCACGMTNSCADPSQACNCDKNDDEWREDSGLLTDKSTLPVKELRFGDTGTRFDYDEQGYFTLGKLKCYGIAN